MNRSTLVGALAVVVAICPLGRAQGNENGGNGSTQVTITEYPITTTPGSAPVGITRGPDGNLWFTEYLGNKIGRITTAGVITEFAITTTPNSGPIESSQEPRVRKGCRARWW